MEVKVESQIKLLIETSSKNLEVEVTKESPKKLEIELTREEAFNLFYTLKKALGVQDSFVPVNPLPTIKDKPLEYWWSSVSKDF